jgi:hypothetical protein
MRALLIVLVVAGCSARDRREDSVKDTVTPLANATQQDLAKELDDAERRGTWGDVKRRWQGQSVRWDVFVVPVLCRSADACNVAAFPVQRPAQQGWLPEVTFAPGQFAALQAHCGKAEHCDVTIEATLEQLDASAELPTNVRLGDVRIVAKTAQR